MPVLLVLGLLAATTIVGVVPAGAAAGATACHVVDGTHVVSGASRASVWLDFCSDGRYQVSGVLHDVACDDRTAHLDIFTSTGHTDAVQVTGCHTSTPYTFIYPPTLTYVSLRTQARNPTSTSPTAWTTLTT